MKRDYGVDSFKFDAGEVTYVPSFHRHVLTWVDATRYTTKYVEAVSKLGPMIEVRANYSLNKNTRFLSSSIPAARYKFSLFNNRDC